MRNLLIFFLISSFCAFSTAAIAEKNSSTPPAPTQDNPSAASTQTDLDPNSVQDIGQKMDGCTYVRVNELGFDEYNCVDKLLHGINVKDGGKCQSFSLSNDKTKYYCLYNIARGGRNLELICTTGWKLVGKKGDVQCKVNNPGKAKSTKQQ